MAGVNKVILVGNLGNDPQMKYTANGNAVTSFRLAVGRVYSGADGERKEDTEWFSVVCWNKLAETVSQYLAKGRKAYVEGRLQTHSWEAADGSTKYRTEVVAQTVVFLDKAETREPAGAEQADAPAASPPPPEEAPA